MRVMWLGASYIEVEGRLVWNHSGKLVGKGYSAWFKYHRSINLENLICVIWLGASYVEAEGRFVWNNSGKLVEKVILHG